LIAVEKKHITNVIKLIHKKDNVSSLEIILLNDNLSDFLGQVKYLEDLNEEIKDSLKEVEKHRRELDKEKEQLAKQPIGKLTSVDFHWYLNTYHGADYFRRWHGERDKSGTLLVHKATHHFDLLNWLIDSI